jgi:hypothetical protein
VTAGSEDVMSTSVIVATANPTASPG